MRVQLHPVAMASKAAPAVAGADTVPLRSRGFTLIEMLIALVILSVSILAMTEMTLIAMRMNAQNELRNTATRLLNQKSEELMAARYADLSTDNESRTVRLRRTDKQFDIDWVVTEPSDNLRRIVITVEYGYSGQTRSTSAVIFRHKAI